MCVLHHVLTLCLSIILHVAGSIAVCVVLKYFVAKSYQLSCLQTVRRGLRRLAVGLDCKMLLIQQC